MDKKKKQRGLMKHNNTKVRQELIELDYVNKLSPKEKEWLNKFNEEYVADNLDRENRNKNLHKTKRLIKDCDSRNNARNRDSFSITKANNMLVYDTGTANEALASRKSDGVNATEDMMIKIIDNTEKIIKKLNVKRNK